MLLTQCNHGVASQVAHNDDVWMHVRDAPGAHVLLRYSELPRGTERRDECMQRAADLAAYYSELRDERRARVAYTSPRHVSKPKGAPLGAVRLAKEDGTVLGVPDDAEPIVDVGSGRTAGDMRRDSTFGKRS